MRSFELRLGGAVLVLLLTALSATGAIAAEFYVAPQGTADGDGSKARPWDLATALAQPAQVKPGDTLWLRGGTYTGGFASRLSGTKEAPITLRQSPRERATIDCRAAKGTSLFIVEGAWTIYRDFEVTCSDPAARETRDPGSFPADINRGGIQCRGTEIRFINLVVHDTAQAIGFWADGEGGEIYGCLLFNNGWRAPDRGHGHGIYTQNRTGTKQLTDNVIFNQLSYGIHAYGSEKAFLSGFRIEGNACFNNGVPAGPGQGSPNIHVGGSCPADRILLSHNFTYHSSPATDVRLGYAAANGDLELRDNYFAGFTHVKGWQTLRVQNNTFVGEHSLVTLEVPDGLDAKSYRWDGNTYFSRTAQYSPLVISQNGKNLASGWDEWRARTGFDPAGRYTLGRATGTRVFVRPNRYEAGRAHVIIYNWDGQAEVPVDLSQVLKRGQRFRIVSSQDYYGPALVTDIYSGSLVRLPMKATPPPAPIGMPEFKAPTAGPEFGVFVVLPVE